MSSLTAAPPRPSGRSKLLHGLRRVASRRARPHWRAVTEVARRAAVANLGISPDDITVVHRGIAVPARLIHDDRARFGLPPGRPVVVNVGRQAAEKDQVTLVRAVARLRAHYPGVVLALAGRHGSASAAIARAVADASLGDAFVDLGYCDDADVLLASCTVAARTSISEGFAAGILEAVAVGIPVIATDIPAHIEIAEPDRLATLVPSGDPTAFATALQEVLEKPPTIAELDRRRDVVRRRYSTDAAASRLRALLAASAAG